MAYNNYPVNYQPMYYPAAHNMPVQANYQSQAPAPAQSSIVWVQGEAGAKSYLVGPNTTVQLWDSESQTIYLKSADASGMPTMKILDYTIREQAPAGQNTPTLMNNDPVPEYVTKSELDAFEDRIQKQIDRINSRNNNKREDKSNG